MIRIFIPGTDGYLEQVPSLSFEKTNTYWKFCDLDIGYSTQFKLPRTRKNERLLEATGSQYLGGTLMRQEIQCYIQFGSWEEKATLLINSSTLSEYNCTILVGYSKLLGWLDGKKLSEVKPSMGSVAWDYSNRTLSSNQSTLDSRSSAIIPYISQATVQQMKQNHWCWLPSAKISSIISSTLDAARSVTDDYDLWYYDLHSDIPAEERNKLWMVLNKLVPKHEGNITFQMVNDTPGSPVGEVLYDGETVFNWDYTAQGNDRCRYSWVPLYHGIDLIFPITFPSNIMICSPYYNFQSGKYYYKNLINNEVVTVGGENPTIQPGQRIHVPLHRKVAFYSKNDIVQGEGVDWAQFSKPYNNGYYTLNIKYSLPSYTTDEMTPGLSQMVDIGASLPDMSFLDMCRIYSTLTQTTLVYEDKHLKFVRGLTTHLVDVKSDNVISFGELERNVSDWAVTEAVRMKQYDHYGEDLDPLGVLYSFTNDTMDQSENERMLKASSGCSDKTHNLYLTHTIYWPAPNRLEVFDCKIEEKDDEVNVENKIKDPVVGRSGSTSTLKKITQLPEFPAYRYICDTSTKVKVKMVFPIESFWDMKHNWKFSYRGRIYTWIDAKWNNGICEMTWQECDYESGSEYYIEVDYTTGGTAGQSGYAQLGTTYYVYATPAQNATFIEWQDENGNQISTNPNYSFTVTGNAYLKAVFQGEECTITTETDPAGVTTTTGGGVYHAGDSCTVAVSTMPLGYEFVGWYTGGILQTTNFQHTFTVTQSATYTAVFNSLEKRNIQVSISPHGVGTVTGGGSYYDGTTCVVTTTPNQRAYAFFGWLDLDLNQFVSQSTTYSFIVNGDRRLQATYYGGYTINVTCSPLGAGNTYGGGFYNDGDTCTVGFTPDQRTNTFDHWEENGSSVSTSNPYTFTVHSDRNLVAVCIEGSYTVTTSASPNNGGTISGGGNYIDGATCTLTATPANGYSFSYWEVNGSPVSYTNPYSFTVTGNVTVTAIFNRNKYTVTTVVNPTGSATVTGNENSFYYGDTCTLTASAASGYSFHSWMVGGNIVSTSNPYSFTVTGNVTVTAVMSAVKYNIQCTVDPSGSGTVSGTGSYHYGDSVTLTATPAYGYTFKHWKENGGTLIAPNPYQFTVTGNRTLVAVFSSMDKRSIAAYPNPEKAGTVSGGGSFYDGETCTLIATANQGATFSHWSKTIGGPSVSSSNPYQFTVNGDDTYYGNFTWNQYNVTVSMTPSGHGTVTGSGTYTYGDGCTCVATPDSGYIVAGWQVDGVTMQSGGDTFTFAVTGNNVVTCIIAQGIYYTIGAVSNPRSLGTITGTGSYLAGSTCTLSISVDPGYTFHHWEDEHGQTVSQNTSYSFTVTDDAYFTAEGSHIMYTVNCSPSPIGTGTITGTGQYAYGTIAILEATPATGYAFDSYWEDNVQLSTNSRYEFTVYGDRNIYARFSSIPQYTISTVATPNAGGSVSGGGAYYQGDTCTLTASAAGKYHFDHWSETYGGPSISTRNPYSFTVSANRTLYANFYENTYVVSGNVNPVDCGTVTGGGTYAEDAVATLTATPISGYEFSNWTSNGVVVSTSNPYSFTVTKAETLTANFVRGNLTITTTVDDPTKGSATGGGSYQEGATCTVSATANDGYVFQSWSVNGSEVAYTNPYSFTVTNNMTLTANFGYDPYLTFKNISSSDITVRFGKSSSSGSSTSVNLQYSLNGGSWTSYSNGSTVVDNAKAITLTPGSNVRWKGSNTSFNNIYSGTNLFRKFKVTGSIKIYGDIASLLNGGSGSQVSLPTNQRQTVNGTFYDLFTGMPVTDASGLRLTVSGCYSDTLYQRLFANCTALTRMPKIEVSGSTTGYTAAFIGCTSLPTANIGSVEKIDSYLSSMFKNCTSLSSITTTATTWGSGGASSWVDGVRSSGNFYCPSALPNTRGTSYIPDNWTKHSI